MKRYLGLGVVLGIVVVGGFFLQQRYGFGTGSLTSFTGTVAEVAARGRTEVCTFRESNDIMSLSGTVYLDGGRVRGDFQSTIKTSDDLFVETHIILKEGTAYTWTSLAENGFQATTSFPAGDSAPTRAKNTNLEAVYRFQCSEWEPDEQQFILPDIVFTEVN